MATVVRMPSVLAGATEAAIAKWLVAPGDEVAPGTPVAEIETEKALVEYEAEDAGTVGRLLLAEGEAGQIGDPLLVLIAPGEGDADIDAALGTVLPNTVQPSPALRNTVQPNTVPPAAPPTAAAAAASPGTPAAATPAAVPNGHPLVSPGRGRVFASPLVRKIAGEKGIDLTGVEGTGPNGRITRRDLERLLAQQEPPVEPAAIPLGAVGAVQPGGGVVLADGPGRVIPHSPMRRAIARRLTESKATTPHFYMATECVVDELLALRARVNEAAPVKASVNDFVVMAVAAAFADVPEANVTWGEGGLHAYENVDISIAVATEGGLVTPVLRDVGAKKLSQVARESADLAQRARDRRLLQRDLEGGVFTVSNLGMYGTLEFSAIINPPQSGILAVGAARQQPVVRGGEVAVATVMRCTLSADHRAIDGALAARWLAAFTARMESPLGAIT
jgi:pyruvate dehydrogenase E2 component (dihydrolipoamide acetyltransferase)